MSTPSFPRARPSGKLAGAKTKVSTDDSDEERLSRDADRDEDRDVGGSRSRPRTDFFSHVADVCRLREPDEARVVEQRDDESGIPYLRVTCRSGLVTRHFPIGALENGCSPDDLQRFLTEHRRPVPRGRRESAVVHRLRRTAGRRRGRLGRQEGRRAIAVVPGVPRADRLSPVPGRAKRPAGTGSHLPAPAVRAAAVLAPRGQPAPARRQRHRTGLPVARTAGRPVRAGPGRVRHRQDVLAARVGAADARAAAAPDARC